MAIVLLRCIVVTFLSFLSPVMTLSTSSKRLRPSTVNTVHLDWSHKQGRILTAHGRANALYTAERGFPFDKEELPHHYLLQGNSQETFRQWRKKQQRQDGPTPLIVGAWYRKYFVGGWEVSTSADEVTFNLQSSNLFIDMRIPTSRKNVLPPNMTSISELSDLELCYFARQHVFCGYSRMITDDNQRNCCTRHHVLDWNFVGTPRPRPNKWYIEPGVNQSWKEWAYATDENGQHYYCEQWERLAGHDGRRLAMRQVHSSNDKRNTCDGIFIAIGNHFQYCVGNLMLDVCAKYANVGSLVDMVDAAIEAGDRETAEALCMRLDAGHGLISSGWTIDTAIRPWLEGTRYIKPDEVVVKGEGAIDDSYRVIMKGSEWEIYDCSFESVKDLRAYLQTTMIQPAASHL